MATVPATGNTFDTAPGAAQLRTTLFNQKLATESVLGSVWDRLSNIITVDSGGKVTEVPESGIMMKLDTTLQGKIPNNIRLGLIQPYSDCPQLGVDEDMLGNEEGTHWKYMTAYYNEIKKAVNYFGWGYYSNEQEFYGMLKTVTPRIITYFAELHDQRIQEAILLTYESALIHAPHDSTNAQMFNPNWFIPNTAVCDQPTYDYTALTASDDACPDSPSFTGDFVETLGDHLFAATNSGANPEYCNVLLNGLLGLEQYLEETVKMPTVKVGGQDVYVYVMPSSQAKTLKDPTLANSATQPGSAGSIYTSGLPGALLEWPGLIGKFGKLLIVENLRYPTLTLGGADSNWTLQPGFLFPGNNDGRNKACFSNTSGSLNYVFHIGYVLGPNAIIEWVANSLKYNLKETTEYEKIVGQAAYTCAGIQIVKYDSDTKSDTSYYCNSSCIVPVAAPNVVTVI